MSAKTADKFCFQGVTYPYAFVRETACKLYGLPEGYFDTTEDLQELVDAVAHGDPTRYAAFATTLTAWRETKKK